MRFRLQVIALFGGLLLAPAAFSQAPKARLWDDCDTVCLALTQAIRDRPDTLEMRLEDALVIREACAAEIVAAAINAVDAQPALVRKIVQTALNVAPRQSRNILYASTHYSRPLPVAAVIPEEEPEEIRRPELPQRHPLAPGEELRPAQSAATLAAVPEPEVRRAIRVIEQPMPTVEIRRAEFPRQTVAQGSTPTFKLSRTSSLGGRRR